VNLNTIEAVTISDIGFFSPIVRQQPKVKYTVTFASSDGSTLFTFEDQQDDQSLDNLAKKIADKIAGRTARCYQ
jgi:adenosine/AMP kinase